MAQIFFIWINKNFRFFHLIVSLKIAGNLSSSRYPGLSVKIQVAKVK